MWPRTHKAQQRNLLPLVSRARGAVSPPARVPQGYSSAKRAVAGLPERNCATISLLRDQPLSSLMATLRILLASINVLESLRTGRSRLLLGRRRLSLTARLGAPEMAHKRKLQKMQAEEAAASLIDDEPPVRRFSLPPPPLRLARLVRCPPDSARSPARSSRAEPRPRVRTTQDPKLLLHQNRQMAHRLEELREEKRVAEAHVHRLDRKQRNFDAHLDTIDQRWRALDEDLRAVLARTDPAAGLTPPSDTVPAAAAAADAPHRFLQRLLKQELVGDDVDTEEITQALKKRCTFTTNILQQVASALAAKEQSAPAKEADLRTQLDAWQHKATEEGAKIGAVEGQLARAQQELQELRSKIDATEDELDAAKRKVKILTFSLQDAKKDAANARHSSSTAGSSGTAGSVAASATSSAAGDANSDRLNEAEEAQRAAEEAAEARLRDSEELREQLIKAEQENVRLQQQLLEPQEAVILRQPTYQCLAFEHAELDKSHKKLQEDFQQMQRELEASTASSQNNAAKASAASAAARNDVLSQLQATQKELSSVRTRYEEVQETMKRQASQPDRAAQVTELNKLVSALRTQLEKQKEEIKSRPRTSETAAIQQDLVVREAALKKQLKDNESKRSSLLAGKKKAEAALADALKTAKKKEKDLVAKADELQIIINVLQNSNKEPRELTELQASEVRLTHTRS